MRVFIIRHGQTTTNIGKANGELEANIPLTEVGINQCIEAGKTLSKFFETNNISPIDTTVYFSPYLRTQNTAEYIAKELGDVTMLPAQRIIERDFGLFATNEYEAWDEIDSVENRKYLRSKESPYSLFYNRLPNGESVHGCYLRVEPFVEQLKQYKDTNKVFVLVTHRDTGKCLLMNFLNEDIFWYAKTKDLPNCSIISLQNENDIFKYEFLDGYKLID